MRILCSFWLLAALLGLCCASASAQVIYTQGFDTTTGANGDVYFTDSANYNGITDGTSSGGITTGASFAGNTNANGEIKSSVTAGYGTISAPQAGTNFLYENTTAAMTGAVIVFSTPALTVTTNTNYTFSYYLANQDLTSVATIDTLVNGTVVGATNSAAGTNTWDKFSATWNSGSATSANFELENTNLAGNGNDFGIDTISITAVPEPRDWAVLSLLLVISLVAGQRLLDSCGFGRGRRSLDSV